MTEKQIVTLLVEEGTKGDPIGSYGGGRRSRGSIVFLPAEAKTHLGKNVRVELQEIRPDSRGTMMFRGLAAPVEYAERWKDNGDETASRVKIAKDWKLEESEVEVLETRKLETKDGNPTSRWDWEVRWGNDLTSTQLIRQTVQEVPTLQEIVCSDGTLSWKQTCSRQEAEPEKQLEILGALKASGWFTDRYCELTWNPTWSVSIVFEYRDSIGKEDAYIEQTKWGELPSWLQAEVQSRYPICSCGRQRRDTQVEDGYGKCELCRAEETCARCGKKTTVKNLSGRLVCADCEPYESAEQMIETMLPRERRETIADEAKKIRSGQALVQQEGESVLRATLGHVSSSWTRDNLIAKWFGHGWYYFCNDGVYGTKLAPAALAILEFLGQATGNGLVEMMAWLELGARPNRTLDYFTRTQVRGEKVELPNIEQVIKELLEGKIGLADRLRGSEPARLKILGWVEEKRREFGQSQRQAELVENVEHILQSDEQDYDAAVGTIVEFETNEAERQAKSTAGELLLDVKVPLSRNSTRDPTTAWAVLADGTVQMKDGEGEVDFGDLSSTVLVLRYWHSNYGYQYSEGWEVVHLPKSLTEAQRTATRKQIGETHYCFSGPGTGWELSRKGAVVFQTAYHRDFTDAEAEADNEMRFSLPINISLYETQTAEDGAVIVGPFRHRDPRTIRLTELQKQLDELQMTLQGVETNWEYEKQEHEQALESALERMETQYGKRPIADGDVFEVTFHKEERQGQLQLVAGPIYDEPSASWIKFVLDPYQRVIPKMGQTCLVRVRAKNSQQLHLFTYRVNNPEGKLGRDGRVVSVYGYFAQPIYGEGDHQSEIAAIKAKITQIEAEISQLEADIKANPPKPKARPPNVVAEAAPQEESDFGDGTMAEALRKAGF